MSEITQENYYDKDQAFKKMHASTMKSFLQNGEEAALAQMHGTYNPFPDDPKALLVGNYVHSYFESPEAHEAFKTENADAMLTKKGTLKADYLKADEMIKRIESDNNIMTMIENAPDREYIIEGDIGGAQWAGKLDMVNFDLGYFIDIKTVKTLQKKGGVIGGEYSEYHGGYQDFMTAKFYHLQMAAYQEMLYQMTGKKFTCYILAVTKDRHANAELYQVSEGLLELGMEEINKNQDRIVSVIDGEVAPEKAEAHSDYYNINHRVDLRNIPVL